MHLLGLIGNPLGHSRSPELFSQIFKKEGISDWQYRLFPLHSINDLPRLLEKHPDLRGFNVTIPYKTEILPFLNEISQEAREVGAVNTVSIRRNDNNYFCTCRHKQRFKSKDICIESG